MTAEESAMSPGQELQVLPPLGAPQEAGSLAQFDVSTDSVVVTVIVGTAKLARRIFIDWGDDQTTTLRVRPGLPVNPYVPGDDSPLPEGTYKFLHAYDLPPDEAPFSRTFLLQVENADGSDDLRLKSIRLVPRFRITQYRAYLELLDPCDLFDAKSELRIRQIIDGEIRERWRWEPNSSFYPVKLVLEGSQFTFEMTSETDSTSTDYTPAPAVRFEFKEIDPGPNQYGSHRNSFYKYDILNRNNVEVVDTVHISKDFGGECRMRIRYDRQATLIRNIPPPGSDWPVLTIAR